MVGRRLLHEPVVRHRRGRSGRGGPLRRLVRLRPARPALHHRHPAGPGLRLGDRLAARDLAAAAGARPRGDGRAELGQPAVWVQTWLTEATAPDRPHADDLHQPELLEDVDGQHEGHVRLPALDRELDLGGDTGRPPRRLGHLDDVAVHRCRVGAGHRRRRRPQPVLLHPARTSRRWPTARRTRPRATRSARSTRPPGRRGPSPCRDGRSIPTPRARSPCTCTSTGTGTAMTTTGVSRPDVAAAYPGWGSNRGYSVTVPVAPGTHRCASTPSTSGRARRTRSSAAAPCRARRSARSAR